MASLKDFANRFLGKDDIDAPNQWGHENPQQSVDINQLAALIPGLKGGMDRTNAPAPAAAPEMGGSPGPLMGEADYDEATGYVPPDLGEEPIDNRSMVSKSTDDAFTQWLMGQDKQPSLTNVDDMGTDRTKAAPKMYFEPMDVEGHIPAEAGTINPAAPDYGSLPTGGSMTGSTPAPVSESKKAPETPAPRLAGLSFEPGTIDQPSHDEPQQKFRGISTQPEFVDDSMTARAAAEGMSLEDYLKKLDSTSVAHIYDWLNRTKGNEEAEKWYAPVRKVDKQVADEQRAVADRLYRQTPSGVRISQLNDDLARIVLGGMPGSDAAAPAHLQQSEDQLRFQREKELADQRETQRKLDIEKQKADVKGKNAETYGAAGTKKSINQTRKLIADESAKEADLVTKYATTVESLVKSGMSKSDALTQAAALYGNQLSQSRKRQNELRAEIDMPPNDAPMADFSTMVAETKKNIDEERAKAAAAKKLKNEQGLPYEYHWQAGHQGTKEQAEKFTEALSEGQNIIQALDEIKTLNSKYQSIDGFSNPIDKYNAASLLRASLRNLQMHLKGKAAYNLGVLNGPDLSLLESVTGNLTDVVLDDVFSNDLFVQKLNGVQSRINANIDNLANNLGLVKGKSRNPPPPPKKKKMRYNPQSGQMEEVK